MKPEIVLSLDGVRIENINFGVVPIGVQKEITCVVENIGDVSIDELEFDSEHKDIKIINAPTNLDINQKSTIIMHYKPETQLDKGVSTTLKIRGKYIV